MWGEKKTGLSEHFMCLWAFCDKCILGNVSGSRSLISLDLYSVFFFWSNNMWKEFGGLVLCTALLTISHASLPAGVLYLSREYGAKNTLLLLSDALVARIELECSFYPAKELPWCLRNSFVVIWAPRRRPDGHTCVHSCELKREINAKVLIQLAIRLSLKSYKRTVSSLKEETIRCVINCFRRHCRCCTLWEFNRKTSPRIPLSCSQSHWSKLFIA